MMARTLIGGSLSLPYQDDDGNDIPIASGEVVYKMSSLTVDGRIIRTPSTVIAEIKNGTLEPKYLSAGVWSAEIRPFSPAGYAKRIKFLADREQMDLSEVIPIPIEGMEVVKGEDGSYITNIATDEQGGLIVITMSDGVEFTFPLPHAALDESDRATLDAALENINTRADTIDQMTTTLQGAVSDVNTALQENLQALQDGVTQVSQDSAVVVTNMNTSTRARDEASTSAQNALQSAETAYTHSEAAQGSAERAEAAQSLAETARTGAEAAQTSAEQSLTTLQEGIASGDFKGEPGTTTWAGITDKPDLSSFVSGTNVTGLWVGTQAEYDALTPDPGTVYVIKEA